MGNTSIFTLFQGGVMSVATILEKKKSAVVTCRRRRTVLECIRTMNENKVGALVVVEESGSVAGIITERDILHLLDDAWGKLGEIVVEDIMTPENELITATIKDSVETLMEKMTNNFIRHIPVMEDDTLIGVISIGDVVKAQLETVMAENESMKSYITGA